VINEVASRWLVHRAVSASTVYVSMKELAKWFGPELDRIAVDELLGLAK